MEHSTSEREAWFAAQEEAGHSKRVVLKKDAEAGGPPPFLKKARASFLLPDLICLMVDLLIKFSVQLLHLNFANKRRTD